MSNTTIREATAADYPTFAKLFPELGVKDSVPALERFVDDLLPTALVATWEGSVAGYAVSRQMKDTVHLSQLVSAPEARRLGIGRALMAEVVRRARASGCSILQLNVRPQNAPAIALYESFGLARVHTNHGLRMDWTVLEAIEGDAVSLAGLVKALEPEDEEALEAAWRMPRGLLAEQRTRPKRVFRMLSTGTERPALAVFDPGFPGASPLRAPDVKHALSLLRSFRPFAPSDPFLLIALENQPDLVTALINAGAVLHMETVLMRGALTKE